MHATMLYYTYLAYIISKASGMLECTTEMLCNTQRNVHSKYIPRSVTADNCYFVLWS